MVRFLSFPLQRVLTLQIDLTTKFEFPPSSAAKTPSRHPRMAIKTPQLSSSRPRTPSLRTPTSKHFPAHRGSPLPPLQISSPTPSSTTRSARPRLKRANSHGSVSATTPTTAGATSWHLGVVPKSAGRRLARSAHLHEVKSPLREKTSQAAAAATVTLAESSSSIHDTHVQSLPLLDFDSVELGMGPDSNTTSYPEPSSTQISSSQSDHEDTDVWEDTDASFDGLEDELNVAT